MTDVRNVPIPAVFFLFLLRALLGTAPPALAEEQAAEGLVPTVEVGRFTLAEGVMESGDEAETLEAALRAVVLHALAEAGIQTREAAPDDSPGAGPKVESGEEVASGERTPEPDPAHLLLRENAEHEETMASAASEPPLYLLAGRITMLTRDQARSATVSGSRRTSYTTVISLSFTLRDVRANVETLSDTARGIRKVMLAQIPGETERRDMLVRAVNDATRYIARQVAMCLNTP